MVSTTSLLAYEAIKDELTDRQELVYQTIGEMGVATLDDVADKLQTPKHTISGRISELKKKGYLKVVGIGLSRGGHSAKKYCATDPNTERKLNQIKKEY